MVLRSNSYTKHQFLSKQKKHNQTTHTQTKTNPPNKRTQESNRSIKIQDLAGDGNHYSATIASSVFKGKSKIEQHKIVYAALKGKMGNELHALEIKTKEKDEPKN